MLFSVYRTVVVYIIVIIALRLMGKRQLGELQPSELVTTFLISNVASLCIDEPDLPLAASIVPIFLIAALEILNSTAAWYCPRYAQLLFGKPVTVVRNGEIQQEALAHLRITVSDLVEALRGKDVFTPEDAHWGVVEPNGSISVAKEPGPDEPPPMLPLLVDQVVYTDNLAALGFDESWLDETLRSRHLNRHQVLLFLHNGQNSLLIPKKAARSGRP